MKNQENRILAVGSVALDTVKTPFGEAREALGGSATFFGASARFFAPVSVLAVIGADFPNRHIRLLRRLGVDTAGLVRRPGKTFRWQGRYDFDLNNAQTLRTELNVFQSFAPELTASMKTAPYLFLANIDPDLQASVLNQMKRARFVACDTMNFWIESKRKSLESLLKRVDIFLCNDSEARELTGEYNLIKASKRILKRGPKLFVIKKGEHGVLCFSKKFTFLAPAYLLERIYDPTGAGDTFAGGFIGYLSRHNSFDEAVVRRAVIYGSVLASFNVESFSLTRLASLKMPEIEARYRLFQALTRF